MIRPSYLGFLGDVAAPPVIAERPFPLRKRSIGGASLHTAGKPSNERYEPNHVGVPKRAKASYLGLVGS